MPDVAFEWKLRWCIAWVVDTMPEVGFEWKL